MHIFLSVMWHHTVTGLGNFFSLDKKAVEAQSHCSRRPHTELQPVEKEKHVIRYDLGYQSRSGGSSVPIKFFLFFWLLEFYSYKYTSETEYTVQR